MRNQVYVMGRFDLGEDEAFVVDVSDGGAEYFTVPLSNIWGTTLDLVDRILQILVLLNIFEERSSQPLSGIKDYIANNPVSRLLYYRTLEAALLLLPLYNKIADNGILIN